MSCAWRGEKGGAAGKRARINCEGQTKQSEVDHDTQKVKQAGVDDCELVRLSLCLGVTVIM